MQALPREQRHQALTGRRCVPTRLLGEGFEFQHPDSEPAARKAPINIRARPQLWSAGTPDRNQPDQWNRSRWVLPNARLVQFPGVLAEATRAWVTARP